MRAILWKNLWVYRVKRHYVLSFFELIVPLLLASLLVYLRSLSGTGSGHISQVNATLYPELKPDVLQPLPDPLYAPNGGYAKDLVEMVFGPDARGFPTEDAMNEYITRTALEPGTRGTTLAVVIGGSPADGSVPRDLRYTLRFNGSIYNFRTDELFDRRRSGIGPRRDVNDPYPKVFWGLQEKMFTSHLKLLNESRVKEAPEITMRRFPYPEYYYGEDFLNLANMVPVFIVYGFVLFSPVFVSRLIREKSSRVRELMRMMGLNDWVYWLGSFANGFVIMSSVSLIMLALFKVQVDKNAAVLFYSDFFLLLVILLLYCTATLLFLLNFTVIFNSPVVGVVFAVICWVASYSLPTSLLDPLGQDLYNSIRASAKLGTSLLPNAGLYWCFRLVGFLEARGIGASWSHLWSPAMPGDNVSLGQVMLMMLASIFLYALLLWYLDNIWPLQYGIPKHPLFFLQRSYWQPETDKLDHNTVANEEGGADSDFVEQPPPGMEVTICLSNVTKRFPGAATNAVENLSLKMYEGQITALLGHNGAGKTTAMNIITGLYPPTSGQVSINGHSILTATKQAREDLGLCPQHNVLFDEMTVEEHLYFFLSLKKWRGISWQVEVNQVLGKLDLADKRHTQARNLSGGMKRKLSLGNAMVGGPKTLILDEPTAGMDPQARRSVWNVLQEQRKDCTILLTTHYMEEADVLGDRIAFLAKGRLRCCGSPIFLKKKYGTGYKMRIAKADGCDVAALTEAVEKTVSTSKLVSDVGHEAVYNLGFPPAKEMVVLFRELEAHKEDHGIASMGVSVTTMEDVFIRVGELSDSESPSGTEEASNDDSTVICCGTSETDSGWQSYKKNTGPTLLSQQARALVLKRWHATRRHYYVLVFMLLIPVAIMTLYCWLDIQEHPESEQTYKALTYDVEKAFGASVGFLAQDDGRLRDFATDFYGPAMSREEIDAKNVQGDPNEFLLGVARKSLSDYTRHYLVGGQTNGSRIVAWYNGEPFHVGAMSLNLVHAAVLRYVTGDASATVQVTNAPLPGHLDGSPALGKGLDNELSSRILTAVFVPTALSFLSSSFVLFPTEERVGRAKLLQLMAGVPPLLFWGVSFAWDFLVHAVCCSILMLPILAINPNGVFLSSPSAVGAVYVVLLLYGWASIPFSYIFSYAKKKPSSGYALLTTVNILVGVIPAIVMTVVSSMAKVPAMGINADAVARSLWFLRAIPNFALAWGFANVHSTGAEPALCASLPASQVATLCLIANKLGIEACCQSCPPGTNATFCYVERSPLRWDAAAAGPDVVFMFLGGVVFVVLLMLCESWLGSFWRAVLSRLPGAWRKASLQAHPVHHNRGTPSSPSEDDDVAAERALVEELIKNGRTVDEALVVLNLKKNFGSLVAVDDVSFRVQQRECFGLLGVNGAGKTTIFRMLTGDVCPTSGDAFIGAASLGHQLRKFQSAIGYCPQFDAQLEKLSGREMLELFALLRGVPSDCVALAVERMLDLCNLQEHADKPTEKYSGGTRRKLSIGMALIGRPPVVFLDEPTAGVDPAARRRIWQGLQEVQQAIGAAVVLTSHSMEECEALCHRLSIMVNGTLKCLGSTQQLKAKFGQGFTILVKLQQVVDHSVPSMGDGTAGALLSALCARMEEEFPRSWELKDSHQCLLHFHISNAQLKWSYLFERMEALKQALGFEDYVISDTTLEQIFLAFARTQREGGVAVMA